MTDNNKDDKAKGSSRPVDTPAAKRPHATLDLKATEIPGPTTKAGAPSETAATAKPTTSATPGIAATVADAAKAAAAASTATKPLSAASTATKPSGAAASAAKSVAPPPPTRARGGVFSHLAAGLAGGAISLFGLQALGPQLGIGGPSPESQTAGVETGRRLSALEQSLRDRTAPAADVAPKLAETQARMARMEEMTKSLADAQARLGAEAKAIDQKVAAKAVDQDTTGRMQKLEEQLAVIAAAANDPTRTGRVPQLAQITGKLGDLETSLTTATTTLRRDVLKDVEARIAAANEASETAKAGAQRIDRDLATVKTDAGRIGQRTQALEQALRTLTEDAGTLKTAVDSMKGDLGGRARPADVQSALAPVAARIAAIEQNVQGVVKSEQDRNVTAERIVLSLELANLKRALDRGGRFSSELAAVRKIGGDKLDLKVLEAAQNDGVPGLQVLTTEFRQLANAMLDADGEPADASVVDRLLSGAKGIVRVRKVNHAAEDKSTEAVIGRMETGVREGRLGDVLAEAKPLSAKALAPAQAWLKKVEARHAIDRSLADIEARLKTSLAGTADPKKGSN